MALTEDRNTPHKDGELLVLGMAATKKVFAGSLAATNATGYVLPAADAAGLTVVGMAEEQVDNSAGANGDLTVPIRRKKAFRFKNSAVNVVTVTDVGHPIYVEDDETVANAGGTNSIVAGICVGVDSAGVWLLPGHVGKSAAVADSAAVDVAAMVVDFNGLLAALRTAGLMAS